MLDVLASASTQLVRRGVEDRFSSSDLPWYGWIIILLNIAVFIPGLVFVSYTLGSIFPTLAIVEDSSPRPAYEPVSLADQDHDEEAHQAQGIRKPDDNGPEVGDGLSVPLVTASIRKTNRLLFSFGGWLSYLRGFLTAIAIALSTVVVSGIFAVVPFLPTFVGTLLVSLALVQLHTAWVHAVISSEPVSPRFWRRFMPFRRVFDATAVPTLAAWAATTVSNYGPFLLAKLLGLKTWDPSEPGKVPEYESGSGWKHSIVLFFALASFVLLVIPARVALVRVQASLLPPDQDTIVAFDRSFGGLVEPAVVGGKGYVTAAQALRSFSRGSWVRLYKQYFKLFLVSMAFFFLIFAIIIPEAILLSAGHQSQTSPRPS